MVQHRVDDGPLDLGGIDLDRIGRDDGGRRPVRGPTRTCPLGVPAGGSSIGSGGNWRRTDLHRQPRKCVLQASARGVPPGPQMLPQFLQRVVDPQVELAQDLEGPGYAPANRRNFHVKEEAVPLELESPRPRRPCEQHHGDQGLHLLVDHLHPMLHRLLKDPLHHPDLVA